MRGVRLWHAWPLLLNVGCADESNQDDAQELRSFLADATPVAADERERLNAAFASHAVRAWGYHRAGVRPGAMGTWSPVTSVDADGPAPGDVSAWVDAGDITDQGLFAPCTGRECPQLRISDEQQRLLRSPASGDEAWQRAERVSGAARRLLETEAEVRWVTGLEVGLILHPDEGRVEINPRLVELLATGRVDRKQEIPPVPVSRPALQTQSSAVPSPLPMPSEPRPQSPSLRSHEPPPGHANSSSDCDCDCDVVDFRCSIEPATSDGGRPFAAMTRQLFVLSGLFTLLLRRSARSRRTTQLGSRQRAWWLRLLPIVALGLITRPADAQAPTGAAQVAAGKAHLARKDYGSAIHELEAARAAGAGRELLEPLAQAYEGVGRRPEAYASLSELLSDENLLKRPDLERIQKQLAALELRVAFIGVQLQPAGASLFVDGHPAVIDPRSKKLIVTPGPHHVAARAEGFQEAGQTVMAQAAARNAPLVLSLVAAPPRTVTVAPPPPPAASAARKDRTVKPPPAYKFRQGPYLVGHVGFGFLTARPTGFRHRTRLDEETNQERESPGLSALFGATAGMRLARGVGIGGLLMYAHGGGEGTVTQLELSSSGTLTHEGPADFTQQSVRLGPQFRFMAGRDSARFLAGTTVGAVYGWVDLEHVHVVESGGTLLEQGNFDHSYSGLNPFWGFDLGAEFNVASHFLLGFALDVLVDGTTNLSGNPFGGTAQGYVGFSARAGFHDWKPE